MQLFFPGCAHRSAIASGGSTAQAFASALATAINTLGLGSVSQVLARECLVLYSHPRACLFACLLAYLHPSIWPAPFATPLPAEAQAQAAASGQGLAFARERGCACCLSN
jgi:hypothetical protein